MKQKLLFIGIIMNSAGTEKAFLSFLSCLDFEKYDVTLILAKNEGLFMPLIPPQVRVIYMPEYGDLFLLSGKNAPRLLFDTFVKKNPASFFEILPYFLGQLLLPKKRVKYAIELFIKLMEKIPSLTEEFDVAAAFWGDRTMFYMIDKVRAKKKIAWMHFDYGNPPRDDEIYLRYFSACDYIVNVSPAVDDALKAKFPQIANKCRVIANIENPAYIRQRSLEGDSFEDSHFTGTRILTIGRFAEQKGYDMIPDVLRKFKDAGYNLRWYILGGGDEKYKTSVIAKAMECGVGEMMIMLAPTTNPYAYMRMCDIYVQPSRYEGKPITVEEAKILCCPIVAANYLSAAEQLDGGKFGLIAEINPESLYQKIKLMIDKPNLREGFSQTLHRENFGNRTEIEKFYKILE